MNQKISRRNFLQLGALSLAGLAAAPLDVPVWEDGLVGRIATKSVSVYKEPWDKSKILYQRYRDELVNLYYEVLSDKEPKYNPRWYRVWGGYIHSAHLQLVQTRLNPVERGIPEVGMLSEVTIPFTQSMRFIKNKGWEPLYRLYYQSVHWVREVVEGPDGDPWYMIEDELDGHYKYAVPATHLRAILPDELTPISPGVDPDLKRIVVSISQQELTAYEGDKVVLKTTVSTGLIQERIKGQISTKTPSGDYHVEIKMPSKHMGDGYLTSDPGAYELPGVPWCTFFEPETGVAFHGTFWHMNWGTPMSHGCVNMRNDEAKWLYRWTNPVIQIGAWDKRGYGTLVSVIP